MINWIIGVVLVQFIFFIGPECWAKPNQNVIIVTLDGVRWQEFFNGTDPLLTLNWPSKNKGPVFKNFWNKLASRSVIYGHPDHSCFKVGAKVNMSLPSYQAMFTGQTSNCTRNNCGRVRPETFFQKIKREKNLNAGDVAAIASWDSIDLAVSNKPGDFFVDIGLLSQSKGAFTNPDFLNYQNVMRPPWSGARFDFFTYHLGLDYLKNHKPRLFFLSLLDSDGWAHKNKYKNYINTLKNYDQWILEIVNLLENSGEYGANTTLIVTTDHGRGIGPLWQSHGNTRWDGSRAWLFAMGPHVKQTGFVKSKECQSHLALRNTVEALFDLPPQKGFEPQYFLKEVLGF